MARLSAKVKIILKNSDDKESVAKSVYKIQKSLREDIKMLNSNEFLLAMNQSTDKLYFRNLEESTCKRLLAINDNLKAGYNELYESMQLRNLEDISKNSPNVREVCELFTIRDNPEVHLLKSSIIKTVKLLRDEEKTMKLILKELKTKYNITDDNIKKYDEEINKSMDIDLGWSNK